MQYSVVNYKTVKEGEGALRLDSEHYRKTYLDIKKKIESRKFYYLSEILSKPIVTGHTPSMANESYYGGKVAFVKTDNVREHVVTDNFNHYLSDEGNRKIKRSQLKNDDVVLTIIGASFDVVGRAALITDQILPANINQNIALIRVDEKIFDPKVLAVYLNSFYGRNYLYFLSRQTEQVNLNNKEVERLIIPHFSKSIIDLISKIVEKSYQLKHNSKLLYSQAEQLLLSELGLTDWKPKHVLVFVKNFSTTQEAERFDAEYFQPKYEEIIEAVKKYKGGFDELGNLVKIKDKNFTPKDNEQYKYIELANISSNGEINGYTENFGNELPSRARRKVQKGDLIVSTIEGSLESIALITEDWENALCSTGFFAVNSDKINSETLLVLLKTKVGQLQLKKGCKGTILTAIGKDELSKIVLPKIDSKTQEEIKKKITEMYETKKLSKSLLEIAKRGVEMAIEKDEQEAEKWIESEIEKLGVKI